MLKVQLTKRELGAIVDDINQVSQQMRVRLHARQLDTCGLTSHIVLQTPGGKGTVDGAEFLRYFFKLGRNKERGLSEEVRFHRERANIIQEIQAQKDEEADMMKKDVVLSSWTTADQRSALDKIQKVAAQYDRRTIGPAGLSV